MDTAKIFISYRREDSQYLVRPITRWLRRRYGRTSVFIDVEAIAVGEDFNARINQEIEQSDVVLALVGPGWASAMHRSGENWVRAEVMAAKFHGKPLIPVLHHGQQMPSASDLPAELEWFTHRNAFPLGEPQELRDNLRSLTKQIAEQVDLPTYKLVLWRTYRSSRTALKATAIAVGVIALSFLAYQVLAPNFTEPDSSQTTLAPSESNLSSQGVPNSSDPVPASTIASTATTEAPATTTSIAATTSTSTTTSLAPTTTIAPTTSVAPPVPQMQSIAIAARSRHGESCQVSIDNRLSCTSGVRLNGVVDIELGRFHSCAVTERGELWCWTLGDYEGDFLEGWSTPGPFIPEKINLPARATDVSIGADGLDDAFTCAVLDSSEVRCWGANSSGQLGVNPNESSINSLTVPDLTGVVSVATGNEGACSLNIDGSIACWGSMGGSFTLNDLPAVVNFVDLGTCCGEDGQQWFFALADDGKVWVWQWNGNPAFGTLSVLETEIVATAVAGSFERVCAVTFSGSVMCAKPHITTSFVDVVTAFDDPATEISAQSNGFLITVMDSNEQLWDLLAGSEPMWDTTRG